MEISLKGLNVLIIGGDRRDLELYHHLGEKGAHVLMYGFNAEPPFKKKYLAWDLAQELLRTHVIITPLNGIEDDGIIYTPLFEGSVCVKDAAFIQGMGPGTLFIAGYLGSGIKDLLQQKGVIVRETREMDEISILNAVPTAEGAVQVAMQNTEITIHNSNCLVLGYGRCGRVLAETLKGMGANVTVAARRSEVLAWVAASRMEPLQMEELAAAVHKADMVFNTVPAVVVDGDVLLNVKKETIIIDLATHPGGIDFAAARRMGIKTIVLPGLPGKVAPKTAGQILCQVYPRLINSALKEGEGYEL